MPDEMRQLTDEEKAITEKRVESAKTSIKYNNFLLKYRNLMLDEGLQQNLDKQKMQYEQDIRDIESENKKMNSMIEIAEKQIKDGVPIKKPEEEKESE